MSLTSQGEFSTLQLQLKKYGKRVSTEKDTLIIKEKLWFNLFTICLMLFIGFQFRDLFGKGLFFTVFAGFIVFNMVWVTFSFIQNCIAKTTISPQEIFIKRLTFKGIKEKTYRTDEIMQLQHEISKERTKNGSYYKCSVCLMAKGEEKKDEIFIITGKDEYKLSNSADGILEELSAFTSIPIN